MKINHRLILIFMILSYVIIAAFSMYPYYVGDEVQEITCVKAIIEKGIPMFSYGAESPEFKCEGANIFFRYVLTGFIFIFGENIYGIKFFMMFFNILTIFLIYLITKEILKEDKHRDYWALVAVFLYAFNPLTIINSIIVQPDGSLLNFSLSLFLYLFIKKKNYFSLFLALLLVFFSKEVGPYILFGCLFLFYLIIRDSKKIPSFLVLFLSAGIIKTGIWFLYARLVDFDFFAPFRFSLGTAQKSFDLRTILTNFWTLKLFIYFAVPFFMLLFLILTILFYKWIIKNKDFLRKEENPKVLLVSLFALVVLLLYFYIGDSSYGFIKYQVIAMPAIAIFVTFMLSKSNLFEYLRNKKQIIKKLSVILLLILSVFFILFVKNPLMPEFDETRTNVNITEVVKPVIMNFSFYCLIPFLFVFAFLFIKLKKFRATLLISLLLLTIFVYFYVDIVHMTVDYSTHYRYGDTGKKEVIEYIKESNILPGEIITHINLGYYIGLADYHEVVFTHYRDNFELFKKEYVDNPDIKYLIIWNRDISKFGENINYFELEKQIGSYYIYKKV